MFLRLMNCQQALAGGDMLVTLALARRLADKGLKKLANASGLLFDPHSGVQLNHIKTLFFRVYPARPRRSNPLLAAVV